MLVTLGNMADSTVEILSFLVVGIYVVALTVITLYCLMQFQLLYYYKFCKKKYKDQLLTVGQPQQLPKITIQLPIYNELHVVKRLLKSIVALNYPKDLMEIQVLDDSTDETVDICHKEVELYKKAGFDITHIRRKDRVGYKAGALKSATIDAEGEFIVIFDADFLPHEDFLMDTMKHFNDPKVGVVQTRWEHLNQNYSLLTRVQAFQLNVHFTVEQLGRKVGNLLLQFNGTAGVWRKSTIEDAGGWEADTLTEDLDLSYRAQLKGWKIVYLEDVTSPAELPAEMDGLKSQQFRWMKGGAETARKVLPHVWKSQLTFRQKLHASVHLLGSTIFLAVFTIGFFSVPMAMILKPLGMNANYFTIFLSGLASIVLIYYVANVQVAWQQESRFKTIIKFILLFPMFLALSMGLSFHNSLAVIQGYLGRKSPFVRTPKFDVLNITDEVIGKKYFNSKLSKVTLWEGFFFLYFLAGLTWSIVCKEPAFLSMHLLLTLGYGLIFYFSIRNLRPR